MHTLWHIILTYVKDKTKMPGGIFVIEDWKGEGNQKQPVHKDKVLTG